jgi:uncharacterized protein YjbI with pentapeptide repeats
VTPEGVLLAEEVLARLKAGASLGGLGLGEVDGRVDLRGIPAPRPRLISPEDTARRLAGRRLIQAAFIEMTGHVFVDGAALRGLDLTGARLDEVIFRGCKLDDCVLDGASGRDLALIRTSVRGCSFRGASLKGAALCAAEDGGYTEYDRVDFTGADLRGDSRTVTAWFRDCDFSGARLDGTSFVDCGLVRCRFAGDLQDVRFYGSGILSGERKGPDHVADLDLSGAVLRNVTVKGVHLAAVRLPDDPGLRVIRNYPCVMRKAAAALRGREDKPAVFLRMRFTGALKNIDLGPPVGLVNRNDYLRWGGQEMVALLDSVLADAERECAGEC